MPNEADLADMTIELELKARLAAVRQSAPPGLEPLNVAAKGEPVVYGCHNCREPVDQYEDEQGTLRWRLFCEPLVAGRMSECQIDHEKRTRRR